MIEETVILAERVSDPRFDGGTVVPYHEKTLFVVRYSFFSHTAANDEKRTANHVFYADCLPRLLLRHQRRHVFGRAGRCWCVSEAAGGCGCGAGYWGAD